MVTRQRAAMPDTMLCGGFCIEEIEQEQALKAGAGRHFRARNHLGEKTHMKCMIGLATMVAASLVWGAASAQTASSFETDNRAKAIGELTDEQIAEALANDGRVAMSGEFFDTDSATLSESSADVLFKLSSTMWQMADIWLAVIGQTDGTGPFEHNPELSEARAQAVVAALLEEPYNIAPTRLVAVGVGPIAPMASNLSDEGRALNRRVTFVLIE
jgi:outer membrane protein OmpA-like peptidoglycan-associated protein